MKSVLFAIFAHPDDEAFGPSGTLLAEVARGTELHLISATLGQAGMNPDGHSDLATIREQEWRTAGALIGASSIEHLGYQDGLLSNTDMITIGNTITERIQAQLEVLAPNDRIDIMTMDTNGISGHVDHIVVARAAAWAFYKLKSRDSRLGSIRFACIPRKQSPDINTDWLYMEPGRLASEIDQVIDNRHYHDQIVEIIRTHHSQRSDGEGHIARRGDQLGIDYFIVR